MLKLRTPFAAGALLTMICLGAAPAKTATPVTYVSGKGADSGNCSSPANRCRTFQFAVNQTVPGGEVKALDPADYLPSISITGVDGLVLIPTAAPPSRSNSVKRVQLTSPTSSSAT
jgi:hypothetical protein